MGKRLTRINGNSPILDQNFIVARLGERGLLDDELAATFEQPNTGV